MQPFSAKELYLMNGGNKLYICKDGFGDVYSATPAEEAEWAGQVIAGALAIIDRSENGIELKNAVENLQFHQYEGLDALLLFKLADTGRTRRMAFATALWNTDLYKKSVEIIYQDLVQHPGSRYDVFPVWSDFKSNASKLFILTCLEGDDDELFLQATITLGKWAYAGLPALRQTKLLETLQPENKHLPAFRTAIGQLKTIFQINTNV